MAVAPAPLAAAEQLDFLAVLGDFAQELAAVGIENSGAYGDFDYLVLTVAAVRAVLAAALSVGGENVTLVAQRQQRPHVAVALQYDMAAAAPVAAVRPPFGYILGTVVMTAAGAAFARPAQDLYIIYEIGLCHTFLLLCPIWTGSFIL